MLWSRLGDYDVAEIDRLLWAHRALFEWQAYVLPMEDLPLYRSRMRRFPSGDGAWARRVRSWLETNASFRRYVLRELRRRGPLSSREFEDRSTRSWQSTGWTGNRNVSQMLEFLSARGEIAIVGRRGALRLWDLAERWYPPPAAAPRAGVLFGFRHRLEIYVPREQRTYGFFVLPVLRGDRLVGRIDPELDRRNRRLLVHAVHPKPGQPFDEDATREATGGLARWLGAETVEWPRVRSR